MQLKKKQATELEDWTNKHINTKLGQIIGREISEIANTKEELLQTQRKKAIKEEEVVLATKEREKDCICDQRGKGLAV